MSTWGSWQPPPSQFCQPASMDVAVEGRHKALRIPCPEVSRTTGQTEQPCMAEKRPLEKAEERLSCSFQALPGLGATPAPGPKLGCSPRARGQGQGVLGTALAPALGVDTKQQHQLIPAQQASAGCWTGLEGSLGAAVWILSPVRIKPNHSWASRAWLICAGHCQP